MSSKLKPLLIAALIAALMAAPAAWTQFTTPHVSGVPGDVTNVLGNTTFINHGLVGVGHISASALDSFGETFGSVSSLVVTGFTNNGNGTYSGTFNVLPDRGYNSGNFYSHYAARINQVGFKFTPYYGATNIGGAADLDKLNAQTNQFAFGAIGGVKFTYFDPITGSNSFTTGLDPGTNYTTLFGKPMPYVGTYVGQQSPSAPDLVTYSNINKLPLDSEALVLKADGSGYIGDEYGANVYYFNSAKQIVDAIVPPPAFQPHSPTNVLNYSSANPPVDGRRNNQGLEGVSLSPDGTRLFALLQTACVQDSVQSVNDNNARYTRLLVYDVSTNPVPASPMGEYVLPLPTYRGDGSGKAVNKTCAQSEIVALDSYRFLVLPRDGNGLGNSSPNPNVYKTLLLVDTRAGGPTNIANNAARNAEGGTITSNGVAGTLDPTITPMSWVEAVNLLNTNQLAKFNVLWDSGTNQVTKLTMGEKWEGVAMVSVNDTNFPNDYFIFVGNDNDFLTSSGFIVGPDGTLVNYNGFSGYPANRIPAPLDSANNENDTRILAFRVTITPAADPAPSASASFNGDYFQNFDLALTNSGTTMPPGFSSMQIASGSSTASSPLTAANVAAAAAQSSSLAAWNAGAAVAKSSTQLYNIGCWGGSSSNRALGSDATGVNAMVIQLALTNNTGATLYGVTFSYDCLCLTNGGAKSGYPSDDLTEDKELPGYSFFYSTTGTSSAANWTEVGYAGTTNDAGGVPAAHGLCLPNYAQGTSMSSGPVNITFATPLTNRGVMYFRWLDDDCTYISADQMLAIDNVRVKTYYPGGPTVSLSAPTNNAAFAAPATIPLAAAVSDSDGTVTNVAFYQGTTLIASATSAPFSNNWANVAVGSYSLTAVARDSLGLSATSAAVTVSVGSPLSVSITSPASGASFTTGSNVLLQASVSDSSGTVTNVSFYSGATLLGQVTTAPFNFTWSNVPLGSYSLTAQATDDKGYTAVSSAVSVSVANSTVASFAGSYAENFDEMGTTGSTLPTGFAAMAIAGGHTDYMAANPWTPAAVASATLDTQTLIVWNAGSAASKSGTQNFNIGCWDSPADRALGTDPTGTGANLIQLSLANNTGGNLYGVVFSYDCKCLTNGSAGDESTELPGYSFFYSLTGGTNASDWTEVGYAGTTNDAGGIPAAHGLCLPNYTQGTTMSSGPVTIVFPAPLTNSGVMYFRWVDDNNVASSPDQMIGIDNVSLSSYNPNGPRISFTSPTNHQNVIPGAAFPLALTASDTGGTITNVTLYVSGSPVYTFPSAPYQLTVPGGELPPGNYALTAVAIDDAGLSATSSVVNISIAYAQPTVSLTSPANGDSFPAPASIPLSASAASADGNVTNVAFYQGSTLLASVSAAPFNYTWQGVLAGAYTLTAQATDDHGLVATSSVVSITVTNGYGLPVVALTSPTNYVNYLPGSDVLLSASATESAGTITNVEFFANGTDLGGVTSAPYKLTWPRVAAGAYALTAVAADADGDKSTSAVVNITVAAVHVPPAVALASPTNQVALDVAAGLPLSATASASTGSVTNVAFYLNGFIHVADVSAAPYNYTWTNAPTGIYSLTAVATDNTGISATSSVVSVTASNSIALATLKQIKTFFIIPLENHDFTQPNPQGSPQQLLGNPACPYFNSLITPGNANAAQTAYATHYFSVAIPGEHPSEPNYIWAEAGTDFGVRTDNDPGSGNTYTNVQHLSGQLTAAGIPWRTYQEDMEYGTGTELVSNSGSNGRTNAYNGTTQYNYAVKHNPMAFFTDTQNKNCYPMTNFWADLANGNIGRYNWITPDQYNEMHSSLPNGFTYNGTAFTGNQAAIAEGDQALSLIIPRIMASQAYKDNGAIIIWTDETEATDDTNTTLPFVIISPLAKGNAYVSTLAYNHSSDLKTMDEVFGLAYQTNAIPADRLTAQNAGYNYVDGHSAIINDFSDFFKAPMITLLNSSQNPSGYKDNVTFTATVAANAPTGTVQFKTNNVALGSPVPVANNVASLSTAGLPRGSNLISAVYSGDANNPSSTNSLVETVTNHPPVAGPVYYPRAAGVQRLISISSLLTNVTDVDGDPVTLAGVGADGFNLLSTNGATLFNNGTYLIYTNSVTPNVNDRFQYTVADGFGGTNQGVIYIIMNNAAFGQGNARLELSSTNVTANFFGIPGFHYTVQRSTNLVTGSWVSISTNAAPANGVIRIQDDFHDLGIPVPPVPASVYYRLMYNP